MNALIAKTQLKIYARRTAAFHYILLLFSLDPNIVNAGGSHWRIAHTTKPQEWCIQLVCWRLINNNNRNQKKINRTEAK